MTPRSLPVATARASTVWSAIDLDDQATKQPLQTSQMERPPRCRGLPLPTSSRLVGAPLLARYLHVLVGRHAQHSVIACQ